jgi:Transposase IS4
MKMSETCKKLVEPFFKTGRNVTTDRGYTDISLIKDLKANGLSLVGTCMLNKADVPLELKIAKGRKQHSTMFAYDEAGDGISLASWCKSEKPPHVVVLASSMHPNSTAIPETYSTIRGGRREEEVPNKQCKSEIQLCYNRSKGGVDTIDMMVRDSSCKRPVNR